MVTAATYMTYNPMGYAAFSKPWTPPTVYSEPPLSGLEVPPSQARRPESDNPSKIDTSTFLLALSNALIILTAAIGLGQWMWRRLTHSEKSSEQGAFTSDEQTSGKSPSLTPFVTGDLHHKEVSSPSDEVVTPSPHSKIEDILEDPILQQVSSLFERTRRHHHPFGFNAAQEESGTAAEKMIGPVQLTWVSPERKALLKQYLQAQTKVRSKIDDAGFDQLTTKTSHLSDKQVKELCEEALAAPLLEKRALTLKDVVWAFANVEQPS